MNRLMAGLLIGALFVAGVVFFYLGRVTTARDVELSTTASAPAGVRGATGQPSLPAPSDAPEERRIPPMFQGRWAPDRLSCSATGETARVSIEADRIRFYESTGQLVRAQPLGAREYALELIMAGEGQQWRRSIILRRVGHEMAFRDAEAADERLYMRC